MELLLFDGFLTNPHEVREHALNSEYVDWKGHDNQIYKRVSITNVPGLQAAIERVYGPVEMLGMGYRLNYDGEVPNQAIHSDLGWGTHALVYYLNDGPSGTAFWRHKATGAKSIVKGQVELFEQLKDDWDNPEAWELRHVIDMKFNRAIIYESKLFHSRFPFEAFGDNPRNGRLVAVAFFTPRGKS